MKKNLIAFLLGFLGLLVGWLFLQGFVLYQQHVAMFQWVQQTDRQLHPQQQVPQPEPTRGK